LQNLSNKPLGIPARNVGGLHTGYSGFFSNGEAKSGYADSRTLYTHVWSEFFIPDYGWIQSDTSAGLQNFAEINEPRLVLFRGEDIELGHGYPLTTVSWFHSPQTNIIGGSSPSTQTWGESLQLTVERVP